MQKFDLGVKYRLLEVKKTKSQDLIFVKTINISVKG